MSDLVTAPPAAATSGLAAGFTRLCAAVSKTALVLAVIGLIGLILCVQFQVSK